MRRAVIAAAPIAAAALVMSCFSSDPRGPEGGSGAKGGGADGTAIAGASAGSSAGAGAVASEGPRAGGGAKGAVVDAALPSGASGTAGVRAAPKPLSKSVEKGLAWLLSRQSANGGFAQGEESANMGDGMNGLRDKPNVADSCMATLALIRAGSTPAAGPHQEAIRKALGFVCSEVEKAPDEGLCVTSVMGTRVQGKIGTYVDTFLAAMLLAESRGKMPDAASNKRVTAALDKVMDKIEKNQRTDGTWEGSGWAPVISQGLASKAMNRALVAGADIDESKLVLAGKYAQEQMAMAAAATTASPAATGAPAGAAGEPVAGITFAAATPSRGGYSSGRGSGGDAGVALYGQGANMGALSDTAANADRLETEARGVLASTSATDVERKSAEVRMKDVAGMRASHQTAISGFVAQLDQPGFVSGFGSNGGEEFLSYMNISETLAQKGGEDWAKWDARMAENLTRIQNDDGSFSGHHCITGRTFCTAAAILVLTADRAPFPVASRVARGA